MSLLRQSGIQGNVEVVLDGEGFDAEGMAVQVDDEDDDEYIPGEDEDDDDEDLEPETEDPEDDRQWETTEDEEEITSSSEDDAGGSCSKVIYGFKTTYAPIDLTSPSSASGARYCTAKTKGHYQTQITNQKA
jgi:hypothetical protein